MCILRAKILVFLLPKGHGRNSNEILPRRIFELMGSEVTQVSCGRCHTLAVVGRFGRVYTFGLNGSGQLGVGTQVKFTKFSMIELFICSYQVNKSAPVKLSGPWIEIDSKEITVRSECGALLPLVSEEPDAKTRTPQKSPEKDMASPSRRAKSPEGDERMLIDEVEDEEGEELDAVPEDLLIIEEPDEEHGKYMKRWIRGILSFSTLLQIQNSSKNRALSAHLIRLLDVNLSK